MSIEGVKCRQYDDKPGGSEVLMIRQIAVRFTLLAGAMGGLPACVPTGGPTPTPSPTPSPGQVNRIALELVADGFTSPLGLAMPDDGSNRMFINDQLGQIWIIDADGTRLDTPFLDIADRMPEIGIDFGGGFVFDERGLLGVAFHPDYANSGRFYVCYNAPLEASDPPEFNSRLRLAEFSVSADPNVADASSQRVILEVIKPQFNHNGGQIAFGPDGFLYMSVGDGGGANDTSDGHTPGLGNGQDRTKLLGKILRLDVDGEEPYAVPADNPFVDDDATRDEIYAFGFRNPYRFSFDMGGERRLFVGDAGQDLFEEVSIVTAGGNYGWNIREGEHCFDPDAPTEPPTACDDTGANGEPLVDPIIEYPHFDDSGAPIGITVLGGYVYRGSDITDLTGEYVFGDFSTAFGMADGSIFAAAESSNGTWTRRELAIDGRPNERLGEFLLGFGQDLEGEVYVFTTENVGPVGTTGRVYRMTGID